MSANISTTMNTQQDMIPSYGGKSIGFNLEPCAMRGSQSFTLSHTNDVRGWAMNKTLDGFAPTSSCQPVIFSMPEFADFEVDLSLNTQDTIKYRPKNQEQGLDFTFDIPPHQQLEKQTSHLQPSQLPHHLISDLLVRRGFPLAFDPYSEEPMENVTNQPQKSNKFASRGDFSHEPCILSTTTDRRNDKKMEEKENFLASEDDRRLSGMERRKLRNRAAARKSRQKKNHGLTSNSKFTRKILIGLADNLLELERNLSLKVEENKQLYMQNVNLVEENARLIGFINRLTQHYGLAIPFQDVLKSETTCQYGYESV